MNIRTELNKLTESDIYSIMMFALYQLHQDDEYSSLSQLSYILDKENLLKLCEFYGGTTIRIPTIEELEIMLSALLLYQLVDIENVPYEKAIEDVRKKTGHSKMVEKSYCTIKGMLRDYNFNSGRG